MRSEDADDEEWDGEDLDEAGPPIIEAAADEDWDEVKRLITTWVDIPGYLNTQDEFGDTALGYAAKRGNLDIATFLINAGANIELKNGVGRTPLVNAAFSGHLEVVRLLVERRADVLTETNGGWTPLMYAMRRKDNSTARYLRPVTHRAFQRREARHSSLDLKFYVLLCQKMAPKAEKTDHVLHRLLEQGICEKPGKGPLGLLLSFMGVHWSDIKVIEETQGWFGSMGFQGRLSRSAQEKPGKKARTS